MKRTPMRLAQATLSFLLLSILAFGSPAEAQSAAKPLALSRLKDTTDDLDGLLKRRAIRILVPYSKTIFFIDRGRQFGTAAEAGLAFEQWLNKKYKKGHLGIHIVFVPTPRDKLLTALREGKGDIVAANLTITEDRLALVDFAAPFSNNVKELLVTGPSSPKLEKMEDLAGRRVPVRASSSYATHLTAISKVFVAKGLKPIEIEPLDEQIEDEDLLQMVNGGLLPYAIVDDHKAKLWSQVLPQITIREDLVVNEGGAIAWAVRRTNPKLKDEISAFVEEHRVGTSFGNTILRRYDTNTQLVRNAQSEEGRKRFSELIGLFRKYGDEYGFDALMLVAQGYQESQLDQSRRSRAGAVGVMQIKPSTAAGKPIEITGVENDADRNIRAASKYMRHLIDVYVGDSGLDEQNRTLLAFAAYNAGPGNLRKFRRKAEEMGLDRNIWFGNVEHAAAEIVGRETVQYVANIYKYFVTYQLAQTKGAF
jgi:membrane-bound lytic murein transglycosylase MltF